MIHSLLFSHMRTNQTSGMWNKNIGLISREMTYLQPFGHRRTNQTSDMWWMYLKWKTSQTGQLTFRTDITELLFEVCNDWYLCNPIKFHHASEELYLSIQKVSFIYCLVNRFSIWTIAMPFTFSKDFCLTSIFDERFLNKRIH